MEYVDVQGVRVAKSEVERKVAEQMAEIMEAAKTRGLDVEFVSVLHMIVAAQWSVIVLDAQLNGEMGPVPDFVVATLRAALEHIADARGIDRVVAGELAKDFMGRFQRRFEADALPASTALN